jgi:hypothetical protein
MLHRLWDLSDPATVYAGLLAYAKARHWKPGWAYFAFVEIYSAPPRPQDRNVEPQASPVVDQWVATRKPKPRRSNGTRGT